MTLSATSGPSTSQKIAFSLQKTFSDKSTAAAIGAIGVAAACSSSFGWGLLTAPLGIASSLATLIFAPLYLPEQLPPLPQKVQDFFNKIQLGEILPQSTLTPIWALPLIEEGLFRGAIQATLTPYVGPIPSIALSSIAFSLVHYERPTDLLNSLIGGISLGVLANRFSILSSLGHHVGVNAFWSVFPLLIQNFRQSTAAYHSRS